MSDPRIQQIHAHLENESRRLLEKVPEWGSDHQRALNDVAEIKRKAVDTYGYRPEDLAIIPDHRHVLALRDAVEAPSLRRQNAELQGRLKEREKADAARKAEEEKRNAEATKRAQFKDKLKAARGNFGARAERIADYLDEEKD